VLKARAFCWLFLAALGWECTAAPEARPEESAPEDYVIEAWGVDKGLPHSTVTSIAQTPDGYLWVGMHHGGLARFDGVRFVPFHPSNTPQLGSISIERLRVDTQGTLWVGTVEGGLISLRNGVFRFEFQSPQTPAGWLRSVVAASGQETWLSSVGGSLWRGRDGPATNRWATFTPPDANDRSAFCQDAQNRVWYRTRNGWLGWFDGSRFSLVPTNCGLSSFEINRLACDAGGRVWVGTERELAAWDGHQFVNMTPTNGEPVLAVRHLAFAGDGSLWVRTETRLRKCVEREWVAEAHTADAQLLKLLSLPELEMQGEVRGGAWLAHYDAGFWHVSPSGRVTHIGRDEGLPGGITECWFQDREGNVWAGLTGSGLVKLRPGVFHTLSNVGEAFGKSATSICQDAAGATWIGTGDGGCFRWDGGSLEAHKPPNSPATGQDVTVCSDAKGGVWVGLIGGGLWKAESNTFSQPFPPEAIRGVVRALYSDRSGGLWIGSPSGLFCWADARLRTFTPADGFTAAYVVAITQDEEGAIWCGTAGGELRRFRNGSFATFRQSEPVIQSARPDLLVGASATRPFAGRERFWALHADRDGPLWIGTLGGGLLRFQQGTFTRYLPGDGLPSEYVSQILEDDRGNLWLGTRAGIARVSKDSLNRFARGEITSMPCVTYGKADGLPSVECSGGSQPAAWRDTAGHLWFTTAKGVVSVQPESLPFNPLPPPVVIEEVRVSGQSCPLVRPNRQPGSAEEALPLVETQARRHYLEIRFTGLSFTAPDQVRFRWKLEGWDEAWVEGGAQRVTSYSYLPPGDYVFRVTACNNDGVWNERGAALAIRMLPALWQTRWFQVSLVLLGLGAAAAGTRFVTVRKAHRRLEEMERQQALERERSRIAKDIHDDLGASLTHITMLTQSARQKLDNSSQADGELTQIYSTARDLTRAMEEVVWAVSPKHDSLDSLATYLGTFAQDFAAASQLRCRLDLPAGLSEQPLSSQVRHNLFLAFKEALHNVARHAAATEVRISLKVESQNFVLTVEDNGRGFRGDALPTAAPPEGRAARLLGGHGLPNMRSRLEEIGGDCEIQSQYGLGTLVRFVVPLVAPLSHK
jgi:signal transduction histidine kinase/ligand-binding sensor domain-containing protein